MIVLGIDPGIGGGIAAIYDTCAIAVKMPGTCAEIRDAIDSMIASVHGSGPAVAFIEEVHTMPDDAAKAAGTFLRNVGQLEMCLCCLEVRTERVRPQAWQKNLSLPVPDIGKRPKREAGESDEGFLARRKAWTRRRGLVKTERKNALKRIASERFPGLKVTLATCDALLIADYGMHRRDCNGVAQTNQADPGVAGGRATDDCRLDLRLAAAGE